MKKKPIKPLKKINRTSLELILVKFDSKYTYKKLCFGFFFNIKN